MKRNTIGQMVIENEKDVEDIINHRVDMNPDLDGEDGKDEEEYVSIEDELSDNYEEIKELRASLKAEHEYLRSIDVGDTEMRTSTIDNMVRISDQIAALDI